MQGQILDFSISEGRGVIRGDDGRRYIFLGQEWKEQQAPSKGLVVDYDLDATGAAIEVYAAPSAAGLSSSTNSNFGRASGNLESSDKSNRSAFDWYLVSFKKYAIFTGRAQRKEYWFFVLFNIIFSIILSVFDAALFGAGGAMPLSSVFMFVTLVPGIAVSVRRLHDIGRTGWWLLLLFVPLVGSIILIIFLVLKGDDVDNIYGPNPLR